MNIKTIAYNSLKELQKEKEISKSAKINDKIVILGDGALIDYISIVNFFLKVETKISNIKKKKFTIKLNDIHRQNKGKKSLILGDFIKVLKKLV